jgi:Fe-S oxidoreductase
MSALDSLAAYLDDIYTCNRTRCGFCREECPVYRVRGLETYSCRGKMLVARGLIEGTLEPSEEIARMADECLLCGYCAARCAVQNVEILTALREALAEEGFRAPKHEENSRQILDMGALFARNTPIQREGTVPLYLGCLYQSKPAEVNAVISVLQKAGFDPQIDEEVCCGYIVEATGGAEQFAEAQARFREVYGKHEGEEILTLCPTCTVTLRDRYGLKVKLAIVAVAERLNQLTLRPIALKATYHDPCHLGRMLGVFDEPREIIRALGIELVEMEHNREFSTCCGGGGGVTAVSPRLSAEIAKNRVRDALTVGAETIITVCPTCVPTLLRGAGRLANEVDTFVDILDLWKLLDDALEVQLNPG